MSTTFTTLSQYLDSEVQHSYLNSMFNAQLDALRTAGDLAKTLSETPFENHVARRTLTERIEATMRSVFAWTLLEIEARRQNRREASNLPNLYRYTVRWVCPDGRIYTRRVTARSARQAMGFAQMALLRKQRDIVLPAETRIYVRWGGGVAVYRVTKSRAAVMQQMWWDHRQERINLPMISPFDEDGNFKHWLCDGACWCCVKQFDCFPELLNGGAS